MLDLTDIGKAEPKPTASATNEICMQVKERFGGFILDCLQNPSERVNNMVQSMALRYISMELYHWIVNEIEKVSPRFASRIQTSNGRYILIALRICRMANGVLTSSLEPTWYKLFFGTLAMPKNRVGACVDAQKWHNHKISLGYIKNNSNL